MNELEQVEAADATVDLRSAISVRRLIPSMMLGARSRDAST